MLGKIRLCMLSGILEAEAMSNFGLIIGLETQAL